MQLYTGFYERRQQVTGLHVDFAGKKRTRQLKDPVAGERLQRMMERRSYSAAVAAFSFAAALSDRSLGLA